MHAQPSFPGFHKRSQIVPQSAFQKQPDKLGYKGPKLFCRPHGHGTMNYSDGSCYVGRWSHGKRHGQGTMTYSKNSNYNGSWVKDLREGHGIQTYDEDSPYTLYIGNWLNDEWNGEGTLYFKDGNYFKGDFIEGTPHQGKLTFNGHVYTGKVVENRPHGKGTLVYPDNRIYEGTFIDGLPEGLGVLKDSNGKILFEGTFLGGKSIGQGTVTLPANYRYEGSLIDGKAEGFGKIFNADGRLVYEGQVENGKEHGKGIKYFSNGSTIEAEFKNMFAEGDVTCRNPEGEIIYSGTMSKGKHHGFGRYTYPNGLIYEGNFDQGKPANTGKLTFADGGTYIGELADNLTMHGEGTWTSPDKKITCKGTFFEHAFISGKQTVKENGDREESTIVNRKKNGLQTTYFSNNDVRTERWAHGKKEGLQVIRKSNGTVTKIMWVDNKKHGLETHIELDGSRTELQWVEGVIQGIGSVMTADGDIITSTFVNGEKHGNESGISKDGTVISRTFFKGKQVGIEKYSKPNGSYSECSWKDGKKHGELSLNDPDGFRQVQYWVEGQVQEKGQFIDRLGNSYISKYIKEDELKSVDTKGHLSEHHLAQLLNRTASIEVDGKKVEYKGGNLPMSLDILTHLVSSDFIQSKLTGYEAHITDKLLDLMTNHFLTPSELVQESTIENRYHQSYLFNAGYKGHAVLGIGAGDHIIVGDSNGFRLRDLKAQTAQCVLTFRANAPDSSSREETLKKIHSIAIKAKSDNDHTALQTGLESLEGLIEEPSLGVKQIQRGGSCWTSCKLAIVGFLYIEYLKLQLCEAVHIDYSQLNPEQEQDIHEMIASPACTAQLKSKARQMALTHYSKLFGRPMKDLAVSRFCQQESIPLDQVESDPRLIDVKGKPFAKVDENSNICYDSFNKTTSAATSSSDEEADTAQSKPEWPGHLRYKKVAISTSALESLFTSFQYTVSPKYLTLELQMLAKNPLHLEAFRTLVPKLIELASSGNRHKRGCAINCLSFLITNEKTLSSEERVVTSHVLQKAPYSLIKHFWVSFIDNLDLLLRRLESEGLDLESAKKHDSASPYPLIPELLVLAKNPQHLEAFRSQVPKLLGLASSDDRLKRNCALSCLNFLITNEKTLPAEDRVITSYVLRNAPYSLIKNFHKSFLDNLDLLLRRLETEDTDLDSAKNDIIIEVSVSMEMDSSFHDTSVQRKYMEKLIHAIENYGSDSNKSSLCSILNIWSRYPERKHLYFDYMEQLLNISKRVPKSAFDIAWLIVDLAESSPDDSAFKEKAKALIPICTPSNCHNLLDRLDKKTPPEGEV